MPFLEAIKPWASKLKTSNSGKRPTIYARKYPHELYTLFDTVGGRSHRIREPRKPDRSSPTDYTRSHSL